MAFNSYVGSFTQSTSTGNQAITGVGFQPKAVLFFSDFDAFTGNKNDALYGFGVAVSSTKRWAVFGHANWGSASALSKGGFDTTRCFGSVIASGATDYVNADFVSMDSDGFTINNTTVAATGSVIYFIALGGTDISVDVGTFTITATGNKAVTGVGFLPSMVLFSSIGAPAAGNQNAIETSVGGMTSSSQFVISQMGQNSVNPSNTKSLQITTAVIDNEWTAGNEDKAEYVSLDADGFTINCSKNTNSPICGYFAIKGAQFKIGTFTESTSLGSQSVTGVGFQPSLVMFLSQSQASSTAVQDNLNIMIGSAVSSSSRNVFDIDANDNVTPSQGQNSKSSALCLEHINATAVTNVPTVLESSDFVSMDSDGFTFNASVINVTGFEDVYIAFAQNVAASTFIPRLTLMGAG